ncbi:hypothetical protein ACQCVP_08310 [Rossellomorea vietnamensis]|uniref:hypothetical protein n=1 Tax=Rossellomorea vietnamensis TaxID=218284 RepID=UPI003CE99113
MSSKRSTFTEGNNRPPSLVGRGTTIVKRDAFSEGINRKDKNEKRTNTRKSGK